MLDICHIKIMFSRQSKKSKKSEVGRKNLRNLPHLQSDSLPPCRTESSKRLILLPTFAQRFMVSASQNTRLSCKQPSLKFYSNAPTFCLY